MGFISQVQENGFKIRVAASLGGGINARGALFSAAAVFGGHRILLSGGPTVYLNSFSMMLATALVSGLMLYI